MEVVFSINKTFDPILFYNCTNYVFCFQFIQIFYLGNGKYKNNYDDGRYKGKNILKMPGIKGPLTNVIDIDCRHSGW